MKDRLTKLFTTFLAVVLLVGMSPAAASTAYAASWNSGAVASLSFSEKLSELWNSWFGGSNKGDSSSSSDKTGQTEEKDATAPGGAQLAPAKTASNGTTKDIVLTKTAKDKGTDDAGNQIFDISLGVTGDKVSTAGPVDVTLVIDTSNSMKNSKKMQATKYAALDFAKDVLQEGSSARISVVQFATDASAAVFNTSGNYSGYKTDKGSGNYYSNNLTQVNNAINALNYKQGDAGGTNTEGGAVMAKKVTDSRNRSDAKSIVIFLTDGVPTYYSNGGVTKDGGYGNICDNTTFEKATTAFENLKNGNRLYGIGFLTAFKTGSFEYNICEYLLSSNAYYTPLINAKIYGHIDNRNKYNSVDFKENTSKSANFTKYYRITQEDSDASTKIKSIYKELSTIINSLASGTIVDKIPEGFELTDAALTAIRNDPNAEYDAVNRTVTYKNVEAGEKTVTNTFEVKYIGNGYGAAYTNTSAVYNAKYYNNRTETLDFPKPVAGLHPKTKDDADSTSVGTTINVDIITNDEFKKMQVEGYTVSDYEIVLTDKDGNPTTYDKDVKASIVGGKLQFTSSTAGTKELYYVVKANITKVGDNFAENGKTALVSRITKVTIDVYGAANKAYVVDFGKPVTYTDTFTEAEKKATITLNGAINNVKAGTYGQMTLKGNGDSITYKLTKFMENIDVFTFNELYNNKVKVEKTVSMVPASSIYYEDNFADEDGNTLINYGKGWQPLGTDTIPGVSGDGNLGYDSAYDTSDSQLIYSNGTIHYVPKSTTTVTADFTFKGQGIDLYSYTSGATGKFTFRVYDESNTRVFNKTINTKYNSGETYQVPAVTFMGEKSQTYRVEIIVPKNNAFYLDAVRIYNSVKVDKDDIGGVDIDNESSAKFVSIREQSLLSDKADLFTVDGDVFIDAYLNKLAQVVTIPDEMTEYKTYGRKTEVVVAPGKTVTITLKNTSEYSKVQLGARIDATVPTNITGGSATGKVLVNSDNIDIKSSTDMYYTVKVKDNGEIVITNNTDKLLALTKLKLIK